jgi:HJR/Mrr/RecB family endonuclease
MKFTIVDTIERFESIIDEIIAFISSEIDSREERAVYPVPEDYDTVEEFVDENYYLKKVVQRLDDCIEYLRRGEFKKLEDSIERLSPYFPYLLPEQQNRINLDLLNDLIETIVNETELAEQYSQSKIIRSEIVAEVSEELMSYLAKNPQALYSLTPSVFEEIVAEIFRKFGFDVLLTKRTHDNGYDIIALESREYLQNKFLIECKRLAPEKKVGLSLVQRLYGVKISSHVTKAFLVTSSFFTKDALKFQRQHIWELELKDYEDIKTWLQMNWGERKEKTKATFFS